MQDIQSPKQKQPRVYSFERVVQTLLTLVSRPICCQKHTATSAEGKSVIPLQIQWP